MRVQQEVGRHHDGAEQVVEVVRDVAGQPADRLHLLLLRELVLERALLRGFERVDDRRLLVALLLVLDRGDEEARKALARAGERGIDRSDLALPFRRLADGGFERVAVAIGDDGEDRPVARAFALECRVEQAREARIRIRDPAGLVDGRDRHRGILEEPHEADFGGALRVDAAVARAVENERARGAGRAVGAERDLVEQPRRNGAAAPGLEVDIEDFDLHVARHGRERGQQRRALACQDVLELEAAGADLREIMVEPIGERGVEIDDVAVALGGKESGRRMIEIVDRVLQFLKHVLVPLELAGHVGQRPDRHAGFALAFAERPHADAQPTRRLAVVRADADLLLAAAALARRLQQAIDRFRNAGIADEDALDRTDVVRTRRLDQAEIGGIGIEHAPARVRDQDALVGAIDHRLEQRARGLPAGRAQNAGGKREQQKHADHRQHGEQRENIGLGLGTADEQEAAGGTDQHERDEQHQADAASPAARARPIDRRAGIVLGRLLLRHDWNRLDWPWSSVPQPLSPRKGSSTAPPIARRVPLHRHPPQPRDARRHSASCSNRRFMPMPMRAGTAR